MTTQHRFSITIACPACAASGAVIVTEDAGPPFSETPRRTYTAEPNRFEVAIGSDPPEIKCVACGARFSTPF